MSQIEVQVLRPRHQDLGHGKSTTYVLKQEDDATVPLSKLLLKPNSLIRLWSAPTAGVGHGFSGDSWAKTDLITALSRRQSKCKLGAGRVLLCRCVLRSSHQSIHPLSQMNDAPKFRSHRPKTNKEKEEEKKK